jgi:hypothetical protein
MQIPKRKKIGYRSTAHPNKIATHETFFGICRRLKEKLELRHVASSGVKGLVQEGVIRGVITGGSEDETHARTGFTG